VVAAGCSEQTPTSIGEDDFPAAPITVEIELPWAEFGSNLAVFGGYGRPSDLGTGVVANAYAGTLNARSLVRFGSYPAFASVRDTTGTTVTDTNLTFTGGRLVAFFDRRSSSNTAAVDVTLGALQEAWHPRSANWTHAVDTIGVQQAWTADGGGAVLPIDSVTWDPVTGDSLAFVLDSAEVAAWADAEDEARGGRIDLVTEGHRLILRSVALRLQARPSVNPDTLLDLDVPGPEVTFVYDPPPDAPTEGMRVGGAPSWRTVLDVDAPTVLNGPPAVCEAVGCPVTLEPGEVSYAALVLRSRLDADAYQPLDTLRLDARQVLSRQALPKSPLGATLVGAQGRLLPPSLFGAEVGSAVEIPITTFVRNLVAGVDPETQAPYANTLALLSALEPFSFTYASFYGPEDAEQAPVLRLIITLGPSMELP
jgi:hypothetical protein